jgi:hypothetical protein
MNASLGRGGVPGGTPPLPGAFPEGRAGGFGVLSWGLAWGAQHGSLVGQLAADLTEPVRAVCTLG